MPTLFCRYDIAKKSINRNYRIASGGSFDTVGGFKEAEKACAVGFKLDSVSASSAEKRSHVRCVCDAEPRLLFFFHR